MRAATAQASSTLVAAPLAGQGICNSSSNLPNSLRSSARSISSGSVPMMGTPTPYSIFANSASNLLGTLPASRVTGVVGNSQLANNSITVNAGAGLTGGGTVP